MAKVHFYYSAMNAGKSTMLLQSSHNYQERGMDTLLLCPSIDDRVQTGFISTRIGLQKKATLFHPDSDLFSLMSQAVANNPVIKCVLIDEAHFLTKEQVAQCGHIADDMDIPVLAYGLRSDFRGEPFVGGLYLLVSADVLTEIKTICHCGNKATMNMRIDEQGLCTREGEQVMIGGNEAYVSTCRKHFLRGEAGPLKDLEHTLTTLANEATS